MGCLYTVEKISLKVYDVLPSDSCRCTVHEVLPMCIIFYVSKLSSIAAGPSCMEYKEPLRDSCKPHWKLVLLQTK